MKNWIAGACVVALTGLLVAAELESGLKVGDVPGLYNVKDVTGPSAGKSLCYRCQYGQRPVVNIFTRSVTPELGALVKEVDGIVGKNGDKKMAAFVTVLAEDADKLSPQLKEMAEKAGIKNVPLTIFDGSSGPPDYKIAKDADVTVLMWSKSEVKANFALEKGKLDGAQTKAIVAATDKILN